MTPGHRLFSVAARLASARVHLANAEDGAENRLDWKVAAYIRAAQVDLAEAGEALLKAQSGKGGER